MVARAVTKKITDLPVYTLNNNQGNILYNEGGVSYQYPMSGIVKKSFTFAVGGTLWSNTDRISDGTYLYYWTGAYPVTVTAGSTVDTLGGVGTGYWVPDSDGPLRELLSSTSGGGAVTLTNGLSLQANLDKGNITFPEMYSIGLSSPSDDDLWAAMFSTLGARSDTQLSADIPWTIDLNGKAYTLTQTHQLDINFNIVNGTLLFNGGQIIMGNEAVGSKTRRHVLKDLKCRYIGTVHYADALIKMARCYNSHVYNCDFWAGVSTSADPNDGTKVQRARYGLWLGSKRAWGCSIIGGEYYGGYIPCRIGFTNDHTGTCVTGGATFHHGYVGNLLLCNPAGFFIGGVNIEHSEDGSWGLCITSGTNGSSNPAQCGEIVGVYAYNNANGTTGSTYTDAGVIIGYDAPGTLGFDVAGSLITSDGSAHSIECRTVYSVSPKQTRAFKLRGLSGLKVLNCKYSMKSGESYGILVEGTAARCRIEDCRNQGTGVFDEVEYTSTNKPSVGGKAGTFLPQLVGATTAGSVSYSTRGGDYSISNGMCYLSLWLNVSAITTQPDGAITITLPASITSGRRSGCGVNAINIAGTTTQTITSTGTPGTVTGTVTFAYNTYPVTAYILSGGTLTFRVGNMALTGAMIQVGTALHLSISYPVDGAVYTGA